MTKHANVHTGRNDAATTVTELKETELSVVTGGKPSSGGGRVSLSPLVITKVLDKSSPTLFL